MSQTDKEARLANKALVVDPAATGESESLSTKEAQKEPETEQEPTPETETEPETETSKEPEATGEETDEDRANREHDAALRVQYDRTHEVAAAGGDNGENEVE